MMVKIHHHQLQTEYFDDLTTGLFESQWRIYRKVIDNNYLFHREAYGMLHEILVDTMTLPFRFLDLACGDATAAVGALKGTRVAHYCGVDLSLAALTLASEALAILDCDAELHHRDFVETLRDRPPGADIVWFGISLHHLQTVDKLALMRLIRTIVSEDGMFLMFEPTSRNGENRQAYLERYTRMIRLQWTNMTPEERDIVATHVQTADYPETASDWMARAARPALPGRRPCSSIRPVSSGSMPFIPDRWTGSTTRDHQLYPRWLAVTRRQRIIRFLSDESVFTPLMTKARLYHSLSDGFEPQRRRQYAHLFLCDIYRSRSAKPKPPLH